MKKILISIAVIGSLLSTSALYAQSTLKLPPLSATQRLSQDFSFSSIDITYSRPSVRGREVFGDLVQYGKVWRTGANGPTKVKFGEEVDIMGTKIKAGEYVMYTIPGKTKWEIVFNTGTTPFGPEGYDKSNDVARFNIESTRLPNMVQTFTIDISDMTYNSCKIDIMWEKTKVSIPIVAHNEEQAGKNIDNAINHASVPYNQAASYIFESGGDADKAKELVDKAVVQDPKAYYAWYLKARIEMKLGHNKEAIEAAKKSMELAAGSALEEEYKHNNQKIIDELKGK